MFWVWIMATMLLVIGLSVWVGSVLNGRRRARLSGRNATEVSALKASGALRHRKSNN